MNHFVYSRVGKRIKEIRQAKGFTQEQLALEANLNRAYIGYIERGERRPSLLTLFKIAKALSIPLYQLFK